MCDHCTSLYGNEVTGHVSQMLPVLDIVGWHHEAQGKPCYYYMHLYQLYLYWWSQYFLTSKDSHMGTPRAPLGLDTYMPPCFHFLLASEFQIYLIYYLYIVLYKIL